MIDIRYFRFVFAFIMALFMSLIISGVLTYVNLGFADGFLAFGWPVTQKLLLWRILVYL